MPHYSAQMQQNHRKSEGAKEAKVVPDRCSRMWPAAKHQFGLWSPVWTDGLDQRLSDYQNRTCSDCGYVERRRLG